MRKVFLAALVAICATLSVNVFATQNLPVLQEIVFEYETIEEDSKLVDEVFAYLSSNRGYDINILKSRLSEGALTIEENNGSVTVTIQQASGGTMIEQIEDLF